jgi:hypothetical protein
VREVIAGDGRVRVAEGERAALEVVRAGLDGDVHDRAARSAELRVIVARRDADSLQGVRRRNDHLQQAGAVVVVDPLDHRVVRLSRLTVDLHGE